MESRRTLLTSIGPRARMTSVRVNISGSLTGDDETIEHQPVEVKQHHDPEDGVQHTVHPLAGLDRYKRRLRQNERCLQWVEVQQPGVPDIEVVEQGQRERREIQHRWKQVFVDRVVPGDQDESRSVYRIAASATPPIKAPSPKPRPYAEPTMTNCSTSDRAASVTVLETRYSQSASGVTTCASNVPSHFFSNTSPAMK